MQAGGSIPPHSSLANCSRQATIMLASRLIRNNRMHFMVLKTQVLAQPHCVDRSSERLAVTVSGCPSYVLPQHQHNPCRQLVTCGSSCWTPSRNHGMGATSSHGADQVQSSVHTTTLAITQRGARPSWHTHHRCAMSALRYTAASPTTPLKRQPNVVPTTSSSRPHPPGACAPWQCSRLLTWTDDNHTRGLLDEVLESF